MKYNRLQFISRGENSRDQLESVSRALDGGCGWVQLRYKNLQEMRTSGLAHKVKLLCETYGATLIINDFPLLAKEVDADGVHVGLNDQPVAAVREIIGKGKIIGGTANTLEDVLLRIKEGCNYLGLGPFRFTATKKKLSPILGIEGYRQILSGLDNPLKNIPIYAIGGIGMADIPALRASNVYGVAVSGAIALAENEKDVVEIINAKLYGKIENSR